MALYINGRPVNPIVTFLVSAVVIAGIIGLGILLLPVIGGLFVIALLIVAGIALYGAYCRWRYGDPFTQMQKQAEEMLRRRARPQEEQPQQQTVQDEPHWHQARDSCRRCRCCGRNSTQGPLT